MVEDSVYHWVFLAWDRCIVQEEGSAFLQWWCVWGYVMGMGVMCTCWQKYRTLCPPLYRFLCSRILPHGLLLYWVLFFWNVKDHKFYIRFEAILEASKLYKFYFWHDSSHQWQWNTISTLWKHTFFLENSSLCKKDGHCLLTLRKTSKIISLPTSKKKPS